MKTILMSLVFASAISVSAQENAGPQWSAFTANNVLYVTQLQDCNTVSGSLSILNSNPENSSYEVELITKQTAKACADLPRAAATFRVDLAMSDLPADAEEIVIVRGEFRVTVKINK
jgi:hypothetical protein